LKERIENCTATRHIQLKSRCILFNKSQLTLDTKLSWTETPKTKRQTNWLQTFLATRRPTKTEPSGTN
jgi:hypothetical protein